jgi:large subunit ribosomal protein L24
MKLKIGDNIVVIAGKDKGKTGKIMRILRAAEKIVVEKVNIVTKHIKKTAQKPGEKIQFEAPIHSSNVMFIDPKSGKRSRLGYRKLENGKKERIAKNSGIGVDSVKTKK